MQKYLYNDLYALEESHWWHKAKRSLVSFFLKKYLEKNNSKILDVGCGTGKNLETFSQIADTWGIDNSQESISFCKIRGLKNIKLGSIEKMPFEKDFFDAVTALDVLEHVDDSKALQQIHRVLKKGGFVVITVPAFGWLWSKWDEVLYHKRRYTSNSLTKVLKGNGFRIVKISYFFSFLVLPALLIRAVKNIFYKNYYPSDFKLSNPLINQLLGSVAKIEKFYLVNSQIKLGTSLVAVAFKK